MKTQYYLLLFLISISALLSAELVVAETKVVGSKNTAEAKSIERGRYLVKLGGCNDCHTSGYGPTSGMIPESQWLLGDEIGWRGPWGTTYASNLRLALKDMTEDQWLQLARTAKFKPPMPWYVLRDMNDQDLRDVFRFIRHLPPAGTRMPTYLPPGQIPPGPSIQFPEPPQNK